MVALLKPRLLSPPENDDMKVALGALDADENASNGGLLIGLLNAAGPRAVALVAGFSAAAACASLLLQQCQGHTTEEGFHAEPPTTPGAVRGVRCRVVAKLGLPLRASDAPDAPILRVLQKGSIVVAAVSPDSCIASVVITEPVRGFVPTFCNEGKSLMPLVKCPSTDRLSGPKWEESDGVDVHAFLTGAVSPLGSGFSFVGSSCLASPLTPIAPSPVPSRPRTTWSKDGE
eukprot:Hpha_TRINITY_DN14764_c0_g1::TRINITY_DN14764_c0_g1_i1::g.102766::m.102766